MLKYNNKINKENKENVKNIMKQALKKDLNLNWNKLAMIIVQNNLLKFKDEQKQKENITSVNVRLHYAIKHRNHLSSQMFLAVDNALKIAAKQMDPISWKEIYLQKLKLIQKYFDPETKKINIPFLNIPKYSSSKKDKLIPEKYYHEPFSERNKKRNIIDIVEYKGDQGGFGVEPSKPLPKKSSRKKAVVTSNYSYQSHNN